MVDSPLSEPQQLTFQAQGLTFAAQAWGDATNPPVLALHGWMDNSASFFRLAPLLADYYVIAVDTAGHGFSSHRPVQEPYNIWQDVGEIFAIADLLGWERFALLGHSRGAIVSMLCAGTFPERITQLVLLDGFMPPPLPSASAPEQLAKSILENQQLRPASVYRSKEIMVRARMMGMWPLSRESATAIIERGIHEVEGGFQWSSDVRLKTASAVRLTGGQLAAFIQRVQAPIAVLLADEGVLARNMAQLPDLSRFEVHRLPGAHHFHMEEQAAEIAAIINAFLRSLAP